MQAFAEQGADESATEREPQSGGGSGFGSPLKVTESPVVSVSICGAVVPSPGMEEVCSRSPAGGWQLPCSWPRCHANWCECTVSGGEGWEL